MQIDNFHVCLNKSAPYGPFIFIITVNITKELQIYLCLNYTYNFHIHTHILSLCNKLMTLSPVKLVTNNCPSKYFPILKPTIMTSVNFSHNYTMCKICSSDKLYCYW